MHREGYMYWISDCIIISPSRLNLISKINIIDSNVCLSGSSLFSAQHFSQSIPSFIPNDSTFRVVVDWAKTEKFPNLN